MSSHSADAIVPIGPFADCAGPMPRAIELRCLRLAISTAQFGPICCARSALVDVRAKLAMRGVLSLAWATTGPALLDRAPSGVAEALAAHDDGTCCALDLRDSPGSPDALGRATSAAYDGGRFGDGCSIRRVNSSWLLDDCALFPLDVIDGVLVPSVRIDPAHLVDAAADESLWSRARARVGERFGEEVARAIDEAAAHLKAHDAPRGLRLKTLR